MAVSSQIYWSVYLRIKINSRNTHWERVGRWTNENVDIHLVNVFVQNVFTWWISIKVFCTSALLFSKGSMSHGKELLSRNCHFTHTAIVATVNSVCVCVCVCVQFSCWWNSFESLLCLCLWIWHTLLSKATYKGGYNNAANIKANNKLYRRDTTSETLSEVTGVTV